MKTSLIAEKTHSITIDKKSVDINELPKELRNEIATLDKIKQDIINLSYELEKNNLAYETKLKFVLKSIDVLYSEKNKQEGDSNDNSPK